MSTEHAYIDEVIAAWTEANECYTNAINLLGGLDARIDGVYFRNLVNRDALGKLAHGLASKIVDYAQRVLVSKDLSLHIETERLVEWPTGKHRSGVFDPLKLWLEVEGNFGGTTGVQRAAQDAAKVILLKLGWCLRKAAGGQYVTSDQAETRKHWVDGLSTGKPVSLSISASQDSFQWGATPGISQYSFDSKGELIKLLTSLAAISAMSKVKFCPPLEKIERVARMLGHLRVDEKDRFFAYGEKAEVSKDLTLIFRKEKVELRFSPKGAAALRDTVLVHAFSDQETADAAG